MFPMEESDQIGSRPIEVLMVDDDANFVKIVEHHLQRYQAREFHLTWKERVADALTELSKNSGYDIILTDYNFPASNGLDFCLRLNERGLQIPIIFLTGVRDFKLAIDAMKLGVEDFIVKEDLPEAHLGKTLVNVLERIRTRRQLDAVEKRMTMAEGRAQAIKELVVTLCHEFNNPLAAIKISADLVERMLISPDDRVLLEKFDDSFKKIEGEIVRLRDLNFERVEYGRVNATDGKRNKSG
ncbi:MAG: hypothetical protein A2X67_09545 [Ignavibacteria bacterium GWA2_55_11]|nr:MAG: hypothetical protein A2X67_09545 [Ignavibacteria bacterium GWA2_55_11]OGU43284.1 MAG: hypothetical protein A2X68_08960 [Ignavibacteria bacterium GWC2_56_12]OGU66804.1 MAG: hypothetical protein A3C56_00420 [Ignavibacteria bacterium RIFCSPHIGHO2_02_FULL_56_12]OGU71423.1 MAG: hypothetical protein A3G43_13020 [Ignavibacteria bacterium RIFCSPLOWO2_12_FULL_56_21]OGU74425.1 MAG: hypothetical protein A3H45_11135 [Ignavibacteria bacterium RIFCSPLOWO2_02_FULL_55_14]HAV24090.1 hypothetical protei